MKRIDVLNCQFSNWYPLFQTLTIKSCIIPLSEEFIKYLQQNETLVLPKGADVNRAKLSGEYSEESWEEDYEDSLNQPEFSKLIDKINQSIAQLGGNVFPKLGWSAPRDAVWINNNSLKCSTPSEIFLLLKSSTFIEYDLSSAYKLCDDDSKPHESSKHELVLRKWANLSPGMEFRCFVKSKQLIGISQREHNQHYAYIEKEKHKLADEIYNFVMKKIVDKFPCSDFAVDLYKKTNGNYWIIDFNPFGEMTDALLFSWKELFENKLEDCDSSVDLLRTDCEVAGQFRFVDKTSTLQPTSYLSYRLPVDFVDLSTGADATKLVDFMRMKIQTDDMSPDSDDDDDQWKLPGM